jgi:hypothetical protein
MYSKMLIVVLLLFFNQQTNAQKQTYDGYPNAVKPVGIIKGLSDSSLLDVVQRQTFRYFWHFAHPVSGLARERDNTVKAEYY